MQSGGTIKFENEESQEKQERISTVPISGTTTSALRFQIKTTYVVTYYYSQMRFREDKTSSTDRPKIEMELAAFI